MTLAVHEEADGSFTIEWDENDPVESVFNTWTEQDFINAIVERAKEVLGKEKVNAILLDQTYRQHLEVWPVDQSE